MLRLFHSTPFPDDIEQRGLIPSLNAVRSAEPQFDIASRSQHDAAERGAFVFASSSALDSALYAFRVKPDTPDGVIDRAASYLVEVSKAGGQEFGRIVVVDAECRLKKIEQRRPTRFTILPPYSARFRQVMTRSGRPTDEWVSAEAIPAAALEVERLDLAALADQVEILEWRGEGVPRLDAPLSVMMARGTLVRANQRLGLAAVRSVGPLSLGTATPDILRPQ